MTPFPEMYTPSTHLASATDPTCRKQGQSKTGLRSCPLRRQSRLSITALGVVMALGRVLITGAPISVADETAVVVLENIT